MSAIHKINETPMEQLHFHDFLKLRVGGKDEFSRLRGASLRRRVVPEIVVQVETAIPDRKSQEAALRWVLRGLKVDRAIRKVETDCQVSEEARQTAAMRRDDEWLGGDEPSIDWSQI